MGVAISIGITRVTAVLFRMAKRPLFEVWFVAIMRAREKENTHES
jgi:hypothetical protein